MSKFGTLVLVKNKTTLVPGFNKAVQIGRTVINFSVKSLTSSNNRNFGPRPQEGLITEKTKNEENKEGSSKMADEHNEPMDIEGQDDSEHNIQQHM